MQQNLLRAVWSLSELTLSLKPKVKQIIKDKVHSEESRIRGRQRFLMLIGTWNVPINPAIKKLKKKKKKASSVLFKFAS